MGVWLFMMLRLWVSSSLLPPNFSDSTGVARKFRGHRGQVGGVSWSGDSRYLVSTAQDWGVWVWDLAKREGEAGWCREVEIGKMAYLAELSLADS